MSIRSRRGDSLVELIVAIVLLEIAGAGALAAALASQRLGSHARHGAAADVARWEAYRAAELEAGCAAAAAPAAIPLELPATPERPALVVALRCGQ